MNFVSKLTMNKAITARAHYIRRSPVPARHRVTGDDSTSSSAAIAFDIAAVS